MSARVNSLSQEKREFDKIATSFIYKSIQIIIQSRLGDKIKTKSKPFASTTDWFNLAVCDNNEVQAEARKVLAGQTAPLAQNVCVEISLQTAEGDTMVLEIWYISLDSSQCEEDSRVSSVGYSRMHIALKSLLSVSRVTPAYKLSRRQGSCANDYVICYRIYLGDAQFFILGDGYEKSKVGSVPTQVGTVTVNLAYRTKLLISPQNRARATPFEVKDDHFQPVLCPGCSGNALPKPCAQGFPGRQSETDLTQGPCDNTFYVSPSDVYKGSSTPHYQSQPIRIVLEPSVENSQEHKAKSLLPGHPDYCHSGKSAPRERCNNPATDMNSLTCSDDDADEDSDNIPPMLFDVSPDAGSFVPCECGKEGVLIRFVGVGYLHEADPAQSDAEWEVVPDPQPYPSFSEDPDWPYELGELEMPGDFIMTPESDEYLAIKINGPDRCDNGPDSYPDGKNLLGRTLFGGAFAQQYRQQQEEDTESDDDVPFARLLRKTTTVVPDDQVDSPPTKVAEDDKAKSGDADPAKKRLEENVEELSVRVGGVELPPSGGAVGPIMKLSEEDPNSFVMIDKVAAFGRGDPDDLGQFYRDLQNAPPLFANEEPRNVKEVYNQLCLDLDELESKIPEIDAFAEFLESSAPGPVP